MEENRRFSLTDLFIKIILVIVFVLFAVWLLSLSNKGVSNSLDVLTDNIFAENIDRMKEVGKEYFTTERLPKKIGEIETITLKEMYEKKLILEVKDKNGNACDAEDSYVSIEKMENEYQMKVNLECGEEEDYIIVIMGCYDYCDTDICEKKEEEVVKEIEYQYKKTTGGRWTDYGKWSEWSKVSVTATNERQVETKLVTEEYTYEEIVEKTIFDKWTATCPSGYSLNADGTKCVKPNTTYDYKDPICDDRTSEGFTFVNRVGFTCNYSKNTTSTAAPNVCPTLSGWTFVEITGLTCKYSRKVTSDTEYTLEYYSSGASYDVFPGDTKTYHYVKTSTTTKYACIDGNSSCGIHTYYTYDIYKKIYKTNTETTTKETSCPTGYSYSNGTCSKSETVPDKKDASCPTGYNKSNDKCSKTVTTYVEKNIVKSCPTDYKLTSDGTKCYKDYTETVTKTGTKEVTYYRYRVREYIGGTTDYKWSKSKNDQTLLKAGYKLTGKTR